MPRRVFLPHGVARVCRFGLALAVLLLSGCPSEQKVETSEESPRRLIFIMLDAARSNRFSSYGYARETTPAMDELAERGVVFENHYAQATHTRPSLPALLYSRYYSKPLPRTRISLQLSPPAMAFRPTVDEAAISFPKALSASGIHTTGLSAHSWLNAGGRFAREFDEFRDLSVELDFKDMTAYPDATQLVDEAIAWLETHPGRDFALYLHFMDTHFPHLLGEDARGYLGDAPRPETFDDDARTLEGGLRDATGAEREYLDAVYDGSLRAADRQIGRLLDYLKANGTLDDTLIVITSDHGEHLWEMRSRFGHRGRWLENLARIPLILFYPGRLEPDRVSTRTQAIDVAPTLLDLLEVPLPPGKIFDGTSLTGPAFVASAERPAFIAGAVRSGRYKILFQEDDRTLLAEEAPELSAIGGLLFDVVADPAETKNLFDSKPEVVARLLALYREEMAPKHRRFVTAPANNAPGDPFAIGTQHFRTSFRVPARREGLPAAAPNGGMRRGWLRSSRPRAAGLLARPGAAPLAIEFRIPNGRYRVGVQGLGDLGVAVGEYSVTLPGTYDPETLSSAQFVDLGVLEVVEETFRADLTSGDALGGLRSFRFEAAGEDSLVPSAAEDESRVERLRALGYLDSH